MNWLDYVLCIIFVASIIGGLRRGFARTVVGVVTMVAAVLASIWLYGTASAFFLEYVSHRAIAGLLGFGVVFFVIVAIGSLAGLVAQKTLKVTGLGWLDRLMGGGVGFVQAVLVAIAFVLALTAFSRNPPPRSVVNSQIAPYVIGASEMLASAAPRELRDGFNESYEKVKASWKQMLGKRISRLPEQQF